MTASIMPVTHVHLGNGLRTSPIGLGAAMSVYRTSEAQLDREEALATLRSAADLGVTFIDTADVYGQGHNERLVGQLMAERPGEVTVATKFGICGDLMAQRRRSRADRAYVLECADASLSRLNTDRIDLYYLHRIDPAVPIEETVSALADLVAAGKVAHIGLCEVTGEELRRAHAVHPITAVQSEWSIWSRDVERSVVPTAAELGVGFVPYSPLGRGFLAGTVSAGSLADDDLRRVLMPRYHDQNLSANLGAVASIGTVAGQVGATHAQVSLAWLRAQGARFGLPVVPIPGSRSPARIAENLASVNVSLSAAQLAVLDQIASSVAGPRSRDADWISSGRER